MIEYGRVLRRRRGGLCCLQRTLNHRALGKAWGLGQRRSQTWDLETGEGRSEHQPVAAEVSWAPLHPWVPSSHLAATPSRGADPPYAPKFIPRRPDPLSKLQMLFCKASVAWKTLLWWKAINAICREGRERHLRAQTKGLLEQICWTTPFAWCLRIPVSKVSLRGSLQVRLAKILGTDPREWSWPLRVGYGPPRGAGGVREFTNYGSLRVVGEGCS